MSGEAKTKRGARRERWLFRRDGVDFGPCSTEEMLQALEARRIDLGTLVCLAGDADWEPAGVHALFRDHYARCEARWNREDAERSADRHEKRLAAGRVLSGGTGVLVVLGAAAALGAGGWLAWRLLHARPTGIPNALALAMPPALPAPPPPRGAPEPLPAPEPRAFPRLPEPETYDTSGIAVGEAAPLVQTFAFTGDEGEDAAGAGGLSDDAVDAIAESARRGLVACAQEALSRSPDFPGTKVSFVVRPGSLGAFTVGAEVAANAPFKACVKTALSRVPVPRFAGDERRVTVPLEVRR